MKQARITNNGQSTFLIQINGKYVDHKDPVAQAYSEGVSVAYNSMKEEILECRANGGIAIESALLLSLVGIGICLSILWKK